ncbi:YebC/PmpR family DNA-binding transcriptional regulator [Candidatus Woesebacteria bacterium]|nr:YebC/PmpR family DNA-binding transcriptional regulator [Candidatus Woesebacteria bacterium]
MSGHSKWNNIKNKKGAMDSQRSKEFAQIAKLIRIAVKEGKSANPEFNPRLRVMLDKARAANMPKEKIERAIERGQGTTKDGASVHEVLYEAYGPGGIGMLIQVVTDNPTRTSAELKFAFSRHGGSLAGPNAAQFLFQRVEENGVSFVPLLPTEIGAETASLFTELLNSLGELEDIEEIFHTAIVSEEGES